MVPIQVYWHEKEGKWVAEDMDYNVLKVSKRKKTAKKAALGEAQNRADNTGVTQVVHYYSKDAEYQRRDKVSPSP